MAISGRRPKRREIRIRARGRQHDDEENHPDEDGDDHADGEDFVDYKGDTGGVMMMLTLVVNL